jgi:HlyD family secretion protein
MIAKDNVTSLPASGAAMDKIVPRRRGRAIALVVAGLVALAGAAAALRHLVPSGLQVLSSDLRVATVEKGVFRDEIVVRAKAEALESVMLDSVESGRVEEVYAADGTVVKQGTPLFRISNPQRTLELLQRQSERAQQISNLSNLRVQFEMSLTDHQRRMADMEHALDQDRKKHARNVKLSQQGFLSAAALEESEDDLNHKGRVLEEEKRRNETEAAVKGRAIAEMEKAMKSLDSGLLLVTATVEALQVRAPTAGRLTDFYLQVGQTLKPDQHIGRIDNPSHFKLVAQIDEFYLSRVASGRRGIVRMQDKAFPVTVTRVFPQISEGRFRIELAFDAEQPDNVSPGQSIDASLALGEASQALVLPSGAFLNDSGGAWAFVLAPDGRSAERRAIQIGRSSKTQVEIKSGVRAGEQVVISSYANFGNAEALDIGR